MTQKEEIQKLIDEETGIDNYGSSDYQIGVCDGVRFADSTMLDRACEWLELRVSAAFPVDTNECGMPFCESWIKAQEERIKAMKEFITAFRQAMEGE